MKKKKLLLLIIISIIFCPNVYAAEWNLCTQSGPLTIFKIIGIVLNIIKICVPLLIIIMGSLDLTKIVISGDEKDSKEAISKLSKRIIAGIIIFFLPTIIFYILEMINNLTNSSMFTNCNSCIFKVSTCDNLIASAKNQEKIDTQLEKENEQKAIQEAIAKQKEQSDLEKKGRNYVDNNSTSNGDGTILLIAGHSYSPYCEKSDDCRGTEPSGYDETTETRIIVQKVRDILKKDGKSVDIANELLGENFSDHSTTKSLFVELVNNTANFQKINWGGYKYALEIHFNASNGTASGSVIVKNTNNNNLTEIDKELLESVTQITGNKNLGSYIRDTSDTSLFKKLNVTFSYLELEFYDNKKAMDSYHNKIDNVAKAIAQTIEKNY